MIRHGHGHGHGPWCLTLDADKILVYPRWSTRPLRARTESLGDSGQPMMGTLILDLYPHGPLGEAPYTPGTRPDRNAAPLRRRKLRDQPAAPDGEPVSAFFASEPRCAATIQKVPLVRWDRRFVYLN